VIKPVVLVGPGGSVHELLGAIAEQRGLPLVTFPLSQQCLQTVVESDPALVLVDAGMEPRAVSLIDELRVTEQTSAVPVIVLGSLEGIRGQAQAAGNVAAVFAPPVQPSQLEQAVDAALAQAQLEARIVSRPASAGRHAAEAAAILLYAGRSMMLAWMRKLRQVDPLFGRLRVSSRLFLGEMPRIVNLLVLVLRHQAASELLHDEELRARIGRHIRGRRDQLIPAEGLVREYQVLRDLVADHLQAEMPTQTLVPAIRELDSLIDEALRVTVAEYVRLAQDARR
jgi:CheY-like chemotaxis protein